MRSGLAATATAVLVGLALAACGPMLDETDAAPACAGVKVDPFKELVVVDEAVLTSSAAKSETAGLLGFRHIVEGLAPRPEDAPGMVLAWLEAWAPPSLTCAWLRDRASNGCDAHCEACAHRHLDLARAPFRPIAIANRVDLAAIRGAGEGRLVFAATDGPGDDPLAAPLPITVGFEFRLPGEAGVWASRWHALGAVGQGFDDAYVRALASISEGFASAENLAQVRVNDAVTEPRGVLREFHLESALHGATPLWRLAPARLPQTPRRELDGTRSLTELVVAQSDAVREGRHTLPEDMLAERVVLGVPWVLPGVDGDLRRAFAASTCDGCHGAERPVADGAFHVSPRGRGVSRLSRFLFDPDDRQADELTRRAQELALRVCTP